MNTSTDSISVTVVTQSNRENKSGINTYTKLLLSSLTTKMKYEIISPQYILSYPVFIKESKGILHFTSQDLALPLVFKKCKKYENVVVTVHDVIPLEYPIFEQAQHLKWNKIDKWVYKKTIEGLQNAKRIITVSDATRKSILRYLPSMKEKCSVIYEYPEECYKKIKGKQRNTENKNNADILYVGSEMPHKNLKILIEALALVKKKIPETRLIKIGSSDWEGAREALIKRAKAAGVADSVIWKDTVENLVEEYNNAAVYVQPSLCEGFGLPIVEAMACGCPVVVSDISVFREIIQESGIYFKSDSSMDLAEKIIMLITQKEVRRKMSEIALHYVKKFNKERFWEETETVYKQMI